MLLEANRSQLVLVDYQGRLMPAIHEGAAVVANAVKLGKIAQLMRVPVTGTEQWPEKLGENLPEVKALCAQTLVKLHFGACEEGLGEVLTEIGTPKASPNAKSVPKHLQKPQVNQRDQIIIAGCESHVCLLQTAIGLLEEEFEVYVVTDACGSRKVVDRDAAFDRLAGAGAELVTTEMVAFEWMRSADHPRFKEVQALIK
jgi:nicotinamidase-related amidase